MSERPNDVTIEPVWLVEATYAPDAAETRLPFRAEHLARAAERIAAGVYIEVGAFADVSGSLLLVRAPSEEAAIALVADDVYMRSGVWVEVRARAFGRVNRLRRGSRARRRGRTALRRAGQRRASDGASKAGG
jgi:uncharacterized protein